MTKEFSEQLIIELANIRTLLALAIKLHYKDNILSGGELEMIVNAIDKSEGETIW